MSPGSGTRSEPTTRSSAAPWPDISPPARFPLHDRNSSGSDGKTPACSNRPSMRQRCQRPVDPGGGTFSTCPLNSLPGGGTFSTCPLNSLPGGGKFSTCPMNSLPGGGKFSTCPWPQRGFRKLKTRGHGSYPCPCGHDSHPCGHGSPPDPWRHVSNGRLTLGVTATSRGRPDAPPAPALCPARAGPSSRRSLPWWRDRGAAAASQRYRPRSTGSSA